MVNLGWVRLQAHDPIVLNFQKEKWLTRSSTFHKLITKLMNFRDISLGPNKRKLSIFQTHDNYHIKDLQYAIVRVI